jgi:hypothetical protein
MSAKTLSVVQTTSVLWRSKDHHNAACIQAPKKSPGIHKEFHLVLNTIQKLPNFSCSSLSSLASLAHFALKPFRITCCVEAIELSRTSNKTIVHIREVQDVNIRPPCTRSSGSFHLKCEDESHEKCAFQGQPLCHPIAQSRELTQDGTSIRMHVLIFCSTCMGHNLLGGASPPYIVS